MKTKELMVGNKIEMLHKKQDKWVAKTVCVDVLKSIEGLPEDKYYRPIKLTKEIFVSFGAEVSFKENEYSLNNRLFIFSDGFFIDSETLRKINFVHELQNFMYIVCNIEIKKSK